MTRMAIDNPSDELMVAVLAADAVIIEFPGGKAIVAKGAGSPDATADCKDDDDEMQEWLDEQRADGGKVREVDALIIKCANEGDALKMKAWVQSMVQN